MYGYRSQPHQALRLLADRADAAEPEALVASITQAVAEALRVDSVWVDVGAADGDDDRVVRTPLVHRGERLGDLAVEVPAGRPLSPADTVAAAGPGAQRRGPGPLRAAERPAPRVAVEDRCRS